MHCWLLFFAGATVYGMSRISEPQIKAVNFAHPIHGRKLTGSVIREILVNSEESCSFECVEEEKCISYNLKSSPNETDGFKCQISTSDRFVSVTNFTKHEKFKYVGMQIDTFAGMDTDRCCSSSLPEVRIPRNAARARFVVINQSARQFCLSSDTSTCEMDSSICGDNEVCIPNYQDNSLRCVCKVGYTGTPCKPKYCAQLLNDGVTSSGVYTINPDGGTPIQVFCDMATDGGGWTVFQKRFNGSVDFYVNWTSYKNGFGDLNGEYWLGNDNLHRLTAGEDVILRVDLEDFDGNITYAEYTNFKIANETDKYRILIGAYNGSAGDSLNYHNNMKFSTRDEDNDLSGGTDCAGMHKGGWWYQYCRTSNLNGLYLKGRHPEIPGGVAWLNFRGYRYSLKRTEMKVKPIILN